MVIAIACRFFFHHHPSHIGVKIRGPTKRDSNANFFMELGGDQTPKGNITGGNLMGRLRHATIMDAFQFHE